MRRVSSNPLLAHLMTLSAFLCYCLESEVRVNKAGNQQAELSFRVTLNAKQDFSVAKQSSNTLQPMKMSEYLQEKTFWLFWSILLGLVAHKDTSVVSKLSIISSMWEG